MTERERRRRLRTVDGDPEARRGFLIRAPGLQIWEDDPAAAADWIDELTRGLGWRVRRRTAARVTELGPPRGRGVRGGSA